MSDSSKPDLFSDSLGLQEEHSLTRRQKIIGIAGAAGGIYTANKLGLGLDDINSVLDQTIIPEPPVMTEIVDGMVAVNEGIRTVSPYIVISCLGYLGGNKLKAKSNPKQKTIEHMSRQDYSDTESVTTVTGKEKSLLGKTYKRVAGGLGVVVLTALVAGGTSGVEHEVSNGPNRPVRHLFNELSEDSGNRFLIAQDTEVTFMSDSDVPSEDVDVLADTASDQGVTVVPFKKGLQNIDGRSGLVIGLPDSIFATYMENGSSDDSSCEYVPAVLDEANDTPVGETIDINGQEAEVVAKISDTSQMNRDIALIPANKMEECIENSSSGTYFGAVVSGDGAEGFLERHSSGSPWEFISQQKFEANNRGFWRKNGTPILLQLIGYSVGIGAAAIFGQRRSKLQSNVREIGTLNTIGVNMNDIKTIETRRAVKESAKAAAIAAPLMPVSAAVFNAAEVGLKVGVGLREVAVGFAMTAVANVAGTRRAVSKFAKNLNKADAVKG